MLLRHLRYLLAVVDHGNFTRAAQALYVSQPTLSQQIKQLEESLGAELLDRGGRTVQTTDAGAVYVEYARRVLRDLEAGKRAIHDVKDLSRGNLRVAMTPTFMAYLAGPLVRDFLAEYPRIHLEVFELSMRDIEAGLAEDSLDIAIAFSDVWNPDIEWSALYTERLAVMVGQGHTLYAREAALTTAELATLPLALLTSNFITRTCIDDYCHAHGVKPNVVLEASSVNALLEIVRHARLATVLPEATASAESSIRKIDFADLPPQRTAALLKRRNAYQSTASISFETLARQTLSAF
ncbi:LysR family transcriptional regulator, cyn operon transcriptional activator [Pseudomonas sp. NFACC02]|uniref:transcriptional regulator CynR n=1 Tax=Pseudomonas sp. NFACC02 TaxID=1566250 RepID=UPI0008D3122D|nr:transcriptional regulator CynR [Pseudomonas sp. NFACC02]SER73591.1 LysR family transcriptional regulator, cyn operon transcriptional activator [Pseudomonas sp. NFACC02]